VYGIFLVLIHGSITILVEANTAASLEKHIGFFAINEIIKENATKSIKLDFAGTWDNGTDHPGQSFGGNMVPYYRIYRNRLFWPAHIMR
jgi:hypothetical protein